MWLIRWMFWWQILPRGPRLRGRHFRSNVGFDSRKPANAERATRSSWRLIEHRRVFIHRLGRRFLGHCQFPAKFPAVVETRVPRHVCSHRHLNQRYPLRLLVGRRRYMVTAATSYTLQLLLISITTPCFTHSRQVFSADRSPLTPGKTRRSSACRDWPRYNEVFPGWLDGKHAISKAIVVAETLTGHKMSTVRGRSPKRRIGSSSETIFSARFDVVYRSSKRRRSMRSATILAHITSLYPCVFDDF